MEYTSYYRGKPSCIQLTYYSRAIYDLICKYLVWEGKKSYSIRLRKLDIHKKEFNLGFLRGLIDTDGNFYAPRKRISFSTVSKSLMDQVMLIVRHNCNLNLTYYVYQKKGRAPLHTIALSGANAKKLIDLVRPRNPSKHGSGVAW
ncbi:hypothetical protein HY489_00190 [Candidatus Woesearchaeota archaeon]|nr:hypothetical protein [Candidatus Woesearchaeota archaeon]